MLRKIVQGFALVGVVLGMGALGAGCLDRPITAAAPTIKTNFTSAVNQTGINKVDILFDIDNSASMGDKQAYLIQAIPQMISRLVTPNCIDDKLGTPTGVSADPNNGSCPTGSAPEFAAVHDMHIGVVTSSLGPRLGIASAGTNGGASVPVCPPENVMSKTGTMVSTYNDDQGHLINRTGSFGAGPPLANAVLATPPNGPTPDIPAGAATPVGGFLYWFPSLGNTNAQPVIPVGSTITVDTLSGAPGQPMAGAPGTLVGDFTELVGGAGESGCGIESQLESWYRFLIQPDPYAELILGGAKGNQATWSGVDATIIQQRHDFLRPDSLVAIIVLTDEDDSEIDVRSFQGTGYQFMSDTYNPPRATSVCFTNPADPMCQSCSACTGANCQDPNCTTNNGLYTATADTHDWGYDLNLRHVHMQQKYALSPQFPLTRYYNGLTSPTVPNRFGEYPTASSGYTGNNNCTNPLFAKTLPTAADITDATTLNPVEGGTATGGGALCALPGGAVRTPADVFYAHIGGVPHQLLQSAPNDGTDQCPPQGHTAGVAPANAGCTATQYWDTSVSPPACADCPQKDVLSTTDWIKILGTGPAAYTGTGGALSFNYAGIDPHMVESQTPRNVVSLTNPAVATNPAESTLQGPLPVASAADPIRPDPINGREWTTTTGVHSLNVDRQYACIFQLPAASQRDCAAIPNNTIEENSCDCVPLWDSTTGKAGPTKNTPDQIPPLCSMTSTDKTITSAVSDYTVQTYAKAYPTIRELMLANMMGAQGIVSSLCPIHTEDNTAGDDPLYGYRPAVNAIVNRLKSALGSQCVPKLTPDSTGNVPCLVLVTFGPTSNGPTSEGACSSYGGQNAYSTVDPQVLAEFQQAQVAAAGDAGAASVKNEITCSLNQAAVPAGSNCATVSGKVGWCYVTGAGITGGSTCSQQISYSSPQLVPNGATISLQCISTNSASDGGASGKDGG